MSWANASILHGGIFLDHRCTQITYLPHEGVFIPFNPNGGQAMRDLDDLLRKHPIFGQEEGVPDQYLHDSFLTDFAENHNRPSGEPRRSADPLPALREFLSVHGKHTDRQNTETDQDTGNAY